MRRGPGRDADDELIGRIRRSSLLLNTHLRDMLTLAKGEAGRLEMRPEPFDACALVESVAGVARPISRATRSSSSSSTFPPDDRLRRRRRRAHRPDPHQPRHQLDPLHRGRPGPARARDATTAAARLLRFTVADTGPGIPADDAADAADARPRRHRLGATRRRLGHRPGDRPHAGRSPRRPRRGDEPARQGHDVHGRDSGRAGRQRRRRRRRPTPPPAASSSSTTATTSSTPSPASSTSSASNAIAPRSAAVAANLLASRPYDAALIDLEMPIKGGAELAAETRRGKGPNAGTRFIGDERAAK